VVSQIAAFGGMAYPLKKLYGLNEGDDGNCCLCLTDKKDTAVLPCGHLCLCAECGRKLKLTPSKCICPLCRTQVTDIVTLEIKEQAQEPEQAPAPAPTNAVPAASDQRSAEKIEPLPPKAFTRISRELKLLQQRTSENEADGLRVSPSGEELRLWHIHLLKSGIDAESALGQEMARFQVDEIRIEFFISEEYPHKPPSVRVLYPTFSSGSFWVHNNGAMCLEILGAGWSAANNLDALARHIQGMMVASTGTIASANEVRAKREDAQRVATMIQRSHGDWHTSKHVNS
jgi:ubiquitin-protein ligase